MKIITGIVDLAKAVAFTTLVAVTWLAIPFLLILLVTGITIALLFSIFQDERKEEIKIDDKIDI